MSELQQIQQVSEELKLEFLLIGGLAVMEHGFGRATSDIDLLIRMRDSAVWKAAIEKMGYRLRHEQSVFQQYERTGVSGWPLDLMLVKDATYDGLKAASLSATVMGASVKMVSLKHLIALKLHALKQGKLHRFLDDLNDVVELVKSNRLDLQSPDLRDLFLRYGTPDLYEKVQLLAAAK